MSLLVWYPFTQDAENRGILDLGTPSYNNLTVQTTGKLGNCYYGCRIYHLDTDILNASFTVATWVKSRGGGWNTGGNDIIFCKNYDSANANIYFSVVNGGERINLGINGSAGSAAYASCSIGTGEWVHLAATYDGSTANIYLNGELIKTATYTSTKYASHNNIAIGGRASSANGVSRMATQLYFNDFRLYDEALSPREIKLIARGLTIHYKLSGLNKNLIKNSSVCCVHTSNNSSTYPITRTIETPTYERQYEHIIRNNITLNPNSFSIYGRMSRDNIDESIVAGQEVTASIWVRCSHWIDTAYMTFGQGNASGTWVSVRGDTTTLKPNQWVRLSLKTTIAYSWSELGTSSRAWDISVYGISIPTGEIENFYLDLRDIKVEVGGYLSQWSPHPDDTGYSALWEEDDIEYDVSGNGYNGTKSNITYTADTPRNSGAYVLNGTNSWIRVDSNDWMIQKAPEMTVNFWASSENWTTKYNRMVSCTEGGGWNLEPGASGYLRWPINVYTNAEQTTGGYIYNNSGIKLADLTAGYHMFTLVYTTTAHNIYIDGDLYSTYNYQTYGLRYATGNSRLYLGCESNGINPYQPFFNGMMSDFRLYYTALSADDIKDLYQVGQSLTSSGKLLANEFVEGG